MNKFKWLIVLVVLLSSLIPCIPTVNAASPMDYGAFGIMGVDHTNNANQSCITWFDSSNFSWYLYEAWETNTPNNLSQRLKNSGKEPILVCIFEGNSTVPTPIQWNVLNASYAGNKTIYNGILQNIKNMINSQGAANLSGATIGSEEPAAGYVDVSYLTPQNISNYTTVASHLYNDLKTTYPSLPIYQNVHIQYLNNSQMANLARDGIVDDNYSGANSATLDAFYKRIVSLSVGNTSYAIIHASGALDAEWMEYSTTPGYARITPDIMRDNVRLAKSDGISHLGFYMLQGNNVTTGIGDILLNSSYHIQNVTINDLNSAWDGFNYYDAVMGIVNHTQNVHSQVIQIAASSDDGTNTDGVDNFSTTLPDLMFGDSWGVMSKVGLRYLNLTIPTAATLRSADFGIYSQLYYPGNLNATVKIQGQTSGTPLTFNSTNANFTSRTATTASVLWKLPVQGEFAEPMHPFVNITSIITELKGLYNYSSGRNLALLITGMPSGGAANSTACIGYDAVPGDSPMLTVDWNMPIYTAAYTTNEHGAVSGTVSQLIDYGDNGTLVTSLPDPHYHFVNWSDGSTSNPRTDTDVLANIAVLANVVADPQLTISMGTGGASITPTAGVHSYNVSEVVNIITVPSTNYHFVNWTATPNTLTIGNVSASSTTIRMDDNFSLTATFALNSSTIQLTMATGTGGASTTPSIGVHSYNLSEVVSISCVASTGYHFVNWTATPNTSTIANVSAVSTTVTMSNNFSVTANFAANYSIGDINHDGNVNILDLMAIVMHMGETGAPGWIESDLYSDGAINILDLMQCVLHFTT